MSEREYHGKEEEKDHEEGEKEQEKERGVGGYEKWRRDQVSAIVWGAILIWAGLALIAHNMGLLDRFETLGAWDLVFIGAGVIVLLEVVFRLLVPAYRRAVGGTIIFAIILLGIGLGNWLGWGVTLALILVTMGVFVLLRGLFRGR